MGTFERTRRSIRWLPLAMAMASQCGTMQHTTLLSRAFATMVMIAALFSPGCGNAHPLAGPFPTGPEIFIEYVRVDSNVTNHVVESGRSDVNPAEMRISTGEVMYVRAVWTLNGSTITRDGTWRVSNPEVLRTEAIQDIDLTHVGSTPAWMPLTAIAAGFANVSVSFKEPSGSRQFGTALMPVRITDK